MTATAKFVPDKPAIAAIGRLQTVVDDCAEVAADIADDASKAVPVDTGALREGYTSESGVEDGEALGRAIGNDFKAGFYEFGTQNVPALAPLRRAAEGLGLEVTAE